jgi:hypothetical protein
MRDSNAADKVYVFGLIDDRHASHFHIGCLPAKFLIRYRDEVWSTNPADGRCRLMIHILKRTIRRIYKGKPLSTPVDLFVLALKNDKELDITKYFDNFKAVFR